MSFRASSPELPAGTTLHKGKLVVVGEFSVGKTSLSNRFVQELCPPRTEPTIGAAFQVRVIHIPNTNIAVKLEIWDTAGSERYRSLMPMYYRDACAAVVCYDITNAKSFERVPSWVDDFRKHSGGPQGSGPLAPQLVLVGTKLDLAQNHPGAREIEYEDAKHFAQEERMLIFETSAKTGENVFEVFNAVALHVLQNAKRRAECGLGDENEVNGSRSQDGRVDLTEGGFRKRRGDQNGGSRDRCSC
jgi:Ras-related protein Rab-5C